MEILLREGWEQPGKSHEMERSMELVFLGKTVYGLGMNGQNQSGKWPGEDPEHALPVHVC